MLTTRSSGSPWLTPNSASDSLVVRAAAIGRNMRLARILDERMCDHEEQRHAAVLNVRVIKNFDYGTLKSIPVRGASGIDLDATTVRQLKELVVASACAALRLFIYECVHDIVKHIMLHCVCAWHLSAAASMC